MKITIDQLTKTLAGIEPSGRMFDERGRARNYQVNETLDLVADKREIVPAGIGRRAKAIPCDPRATSVPDAFASALLRAEDRTKVETVTDAGTVTEQQRTEIVFGRIVKDANIEAEFKAAMAQRLKNDHATASNPEKTPTKKKTPAKPVIDTVKV